MMLQVDIHRVGYKKGKMDIKWEKKGKGKICEAEVESTWVE